MKGDKRVYQPEHYEKAYKALPDIYKIYQEKGRMCIAIGGQSGVGKTEVTDIIQHSLWEKYKVRVKVIHLDDYYKIHWERRNEWRKERGLKGVGLTEIKWGMIKNIIKKFRIYSTLKVQQIHRYINAIENTFVSSRNIDILIFEGLYACHLKKKNLVDYAVFLSGNIEDTYKFRKQRAKENPDDNFRQKTLEKEAYVVNKTKSFADIIIDYKL